MDKPYFRLLTLIALLTISTWGIVQAQEVLVPLCLAALLGFLLVPGVKFLKQHKVPEVPALILVTLVFFTPLAWVIYEALIQGEALVRDFPKILAFMKKEFTIFSAGPWGSRLHFQGDADLSDWTDRIGQEAGAGIGIALKGIRVLLTTSGHFVLILFFSILMLASRNRLILSAEAILKTSRSAAFSKNPRKFVNSIVVLIERFLLVRLAIVLFVAGCDWIILASFGLRYAVFAASFLGLMTLIPVVGFLVGVIPPLLLCAAGEFSLAKTGGVFIALILISNIEAHFLSPKLLGKHLNLNLFSTFVGLFIGEKLWGGWGMFLSIPLLGILRICLSMSPELIPWSNLISDTDSREP